jgi:hypothetical protein
MRSRSQRTENDKHVPRNLLRAVAWTGLGLMGLGCGHQAYIPPPPPEPIFRPAPAISVQTPGVTIEADDGAFAIGSAPVQSPFDMGASCLTNPATTNLELAEGQGARRVIIKLPPELAEVADGQTQLHGVLAICGVPPGTAGAASRHYLVQVPENRIAQTAGGRVSLVYEPFVDDSGDRKAWMLWLSRTPLPPSPYARSRAVTGP